MSANEIKEKKLRGLFNDIKTKKKTSITSNSIKLIAYSVACLGENCGLFIVGNNSYQLYKEVTLITNKKCLYIDTLYETALYPRELNKSSVQEIKRTEQQIEEGGVGIFFCEDNPSKRKVHVKNISKTSININFLIKFFIIHTVIFPSYILFICFRHS